MEEIDLKEIFKIFWKRKLTIVLITLLFLTIGGVYTMFFIQPKYTSTATLILAGGSGTKESASEGITQTDLTINSKLVTTYSQIIKSDRVLAPVLENIPDRITKDELKKAIAVSSVTNTELIDIKVTTDSAKKSTRIANELSKVFINEINDIYKMNNIQILVEAEDNDIPSNINHKKDLLMFGLIGIVLGFAYVFVLNMLDTTIKTTDDVEGIFGISLLATIPTYEWEMTVSDRKKKRGGNR